MGTTIAYLQAFSAYDFPSVNALVQYFHLATGLPVRYTWWQAIKCGNYSSWKGLTYTNPAKYFPSSDRTVMKHLIQSRQGVRSTKPKLYDSQTITLTVGPPIEPSQELHTHIEHIRKLYTDDTERFPIRSRRGNQYLMIAYHCVLMPSLSSPSSHVRINIKSSRTMKLWLDQNNAVNLWTYKY